MILWINDEWRHRTVRCPVCGSDVPTRSLWLVRRWWPVTRRYVGPHDIHGRPPLSTRDEICPGVALEVMS